jgi:hypothetical protein
VIARGSGGGHRVKMRRDNHHANRKRRARVRDALASGERGG